jgi:hypothetical protein
MRARTIRLSVAVLAFTLAGCSGFGGPPGPDHCKVDVVGVESITDRPDTFDIAVRVRGEAGSPAVVSLAARTGSDSYVAGYGVEVGPGPFEAIVEQKLTGRPAGLVVLLEVAGNRCRANVKTR